MTERLPRREPEEPECTRRRFLAAASVTAGATLLPALSACEGGERGTGAPDPPDRHALYDLGLVDIDTSSWFDAQAIEADPPLVGDAEAEVVVVGAGLAGSSLALHLAERGVDTVLLEARQPGWGASGRNAGHVGPAFDLAKLAHLPDGGAAYADLFESQHDLCFEIADRYAIECDADQSGLVHAIQRESVFMTEANRIADPWLERGSQPIEVLDAEAMWETTGSRRYRAGLLWKNGGRFNPWSFTRGMATAAAANGARVYGESPVEGIERRGDAWHVSTPEGHVACDQVVVCTNGYTHGVVPALDTCYSPITAYGVATRPLPGELRERIMPGASIMQQVPVNMHSFLVDGRGRIVSSLLPRAGEPEAAAPHFQDLVGWLHETWPESRDFEIELEGYWTGAMAFSEDGLPKIYRVEDGLYGLMSFSGSGNVHAPLLGRHLAEVIVGGDWSRLALPLEVPEPVARPRWKSLMYRRGLVPLGRWGEALSII